MKTSSHTITAVCLALLCLCGAHRPSLPAAPAPDGELPHWAAKTIPVAERYETEKAAAEYAADVRPSLPDTAPAAPARPRKLLVFHNPRNFRHTAEVLLRMALPEMGEKTGAYTAVVTSDPAAFTPDALEQFDALFFNNVNSVNHIGSPDEAGCRAIIDFVRQGGGFAANHASLVALNRDPDYAVLIGGTFRNHPFGGREVTIRNEHPDSPLTRAFGAEPFPYTDEIFTVGPPFDRAKARVLLSIDWDQSPAAQAIDADLRAKGRTGGLRDDNDYPVSWIKPYGEGRVFYTSLGHEHSTIADPAYLAHILAGIQYACGDLAAPEED